ncbi:hypothetical protein JW859_01685 [bacterium]|nr:hypothetical protein [bacterium]
MTASKRRIRGRPDLGIAVDERRSRSARAIDRRDSLGAAAVTPLGGTAPVGGDLPAYPETLVTSLKKSGAATALSGAIEITGTGGTSITQAATAPHFTVDTAEPLWQRSSTTLSPQASGDRVELNGAHEDGTLQVSASGENNPAIWAEATAGYAVKATGTSQLGLLSDGVIDTAQMNEANVDAAPAGYGRWYVSTAGRPYVLDSSNRRHDLGVQHKQVAWGALIAGGGHEETWDAAAYPDTATAATVAATRAYSCDFSTGDVSSCYGRWSWQASASGDPLSVTQSQVSVGVPFRKYGDGSNRDNNCRIIISARLRVSDPDHFDAIYLFVNDLSNNRLLNDVVTEVIANNWLVLYLPEVHWINAATWQSSLRAGIWARGRTLNSETSDNVFLDIEWISIEQWVY